MSSSPYSYPSNRSKYLVESKSTDAQQATECECAPFFVDLKSLSENQLDHLRSVGLLSAPLLQRVEDTSALTTKAAKLLGVDDDGDSEITGRRVELLEEIYPSSAANNNNDHD